MQKQTAYRHSDQIKKMIEGIKFICGYSTNKEVVEESIRQFYIYLKKNEEIVGQMPEEVPEIK